jgi:diguanylate cyclase (GGDEF)-like protein/PAS domain S-box-containing protein
VEHDDQDAAPPDEPIVIELDGELRHVRLSDAALAMVGLPTEAVLGRTPSETGLPAEVVVPLERELRVALDTGEERHLELEMPTVDGLRWLFLRLVPDGAGAVRLLASDITLRKHAELRLTGGHAAFRALVEDSPDPVARVDADLRIGFVNSAFERAAGEPASAFLGRPVAEAPLPPEVAARWEDGVRSVFERGERLAVDFRFPSEGGARWFSARLLPEPGPAGGVEHVITAFTDITDRVNQEAEQAALRRVATVVAREGDLEEIGRVVAEEATLLLGATGSAVYRFESPEVATCVAAHPPPADGVVVSPTLSIGGTTATGLTARTGEAARVDDYRDLPADASVDQVLEAGLRSGIAAPLATGGRVWGALTAGSTEPGAFAPADERRLAAFAELAAIAVANAEARAELARLAETDPLTGLANRRAFTKRLNGEVERARRHGHLLTLVILDLDDFKGINDTHGHQVGDHVLAEVGHQLCATSRAGELIARIGGEEFAWILPQVDAAGAMAPVERARARIAGIRVDGVSGITCSAGVCDLTAARDVDELQRRADRALYSAKRAGRDRVEAAVP